MADASTIERALADLDAVVAEVVAYCRSHGDQGRSTAEGWVAGDLLSHLHYYHNVIAWGIQSIALGMSPWRNPWLADQTNAVCMPLHDGESMEELAVQMELAHRRLLKAARAAVNPDAIIHLRADGETVTLLRRLTEAANHWRGHLADVRGGRC